MSIQEILADCPRNGFKANTEAATISGLAEGVAFLARLGEGTLELSVNLPEANLAKLQNKLSGRYEGVTVAYRNFGIAVAFPGLQDLSGETFAAFVKTAAADAVRLAGTSFDDKFEKDKEPFTAYLKGIAGGFLGAPLGVLPWFIASTFIHFQLWILGFLVSTASYYGYQRLYGAHNTSFATTTIVISTLLAMFLSQLAELTVNLARSVENFAFPSTLLLYLQQNGWQSILSSMLFGMIAAGIGLLTIRQRVLAYTHSSWYLRRSKRK